MASMAEKKKKKKPASLGCLFWIAFILLIIVLFFFNKKNISEVLEKTDIANLLSGKGHTVEKTEDGKTAVVPALNTTETSGAAPDANSAPATSTGDGSKEREKAPQETVKPAKKEPTPVTPEKKTTVTAEKPPATPTVKPTAKQVEPATKTPPEKKILTRKGTLFFVTIDPDGRVIRKELTRDIPQTDSPLTETLQALFKGPTSAETNKGYRSLIPAGSKLLSANVKNGIATLNLSEEFQFNQYGIEGYLGQLSQIVFTATAFSTVTSVQFLIEGQRREYLGAEGVWIGTPLSRDKFQ